MRRRLLALSLALVMTCALMLVSVGPVQAADAGLDLSSTTTGLQKGGMADVVVKSVDADGNVGGQVTNGLTFESSAPGVITVDAAGKMTALREGVAIVTAKSGTLQKSVVVTVYKKKTEDGFEDTTVARTMLSPQYGSVVIDPKNYWCEYDSNIKRNGNYSLKILDITADKPDENLPSWNGGVFFSCDKTWPASGDRTQRGVAELWFYDDAVPTKSNQFWISSAGGQYDGKSPTGYDQDGTWSWSEALRVSFRFGADSYGLGTDGDKGNPSQNTGCAKYFGVVEVKNQVARTKGWHQLIIDYSRDDTYAFYIDGQLFASRTAPKSNGGLAGIRLDRTGGSKQHLLYLDDAVDYTDISVTDPVAPEAGNVAISGIAKEGQKLTVSYGYYDANNDPEDKAKTQYQWERSSNGSDWAAIDGAISTSYTLQAADVGNYIRVQVKVFAQSVEQSEGTFTASAPTEEKVLARPPLTEETISRLDLSQTETFLAAETSGTQVKIQGFSTDGTAYDLTADPAVGYQTSDPYVAKVGANGAITARHNGFAIITATVNNTDGSVVTGKTVIQVYTTNAGYTDATKINIPTTASIKFKGDDQARENIKVNNSHVMIANDYTRTGAVPAIGYHKPGTMASGMQFSDYDENDPLKQPANYLTWGLDNYNTMADGTKIPQMIGQAWFYDEGPDSTRQATIYFQGHDKHPAGVTYPQTLAAKVGILNGSSKFYAYSNSKQKRAQVGESAAVIESGGFTGSADDVTHILDGTGGLPEIPRTRGWHQALMVVNGGDDLTNVGTDKGTITLYLDGIKVYQENYVPLTLQLARGEGHGAAYSGDYSYYDGFGIAYYDVKTRPPVVESIALSGTAMIGKALTADAHVKDLKGDPLAQETYQWQYADAANAEEWSDIPGATNASYSFEDSETNPYLNKYVRVAVTPHSTIPEKEANVEPYYSEPRKVSAKKLAPELVGGITVAGSQTVGGQLTVAYQYKQDDMIDEEGDTIFLWERADSADAQSWTTAATITGNNTYSPAAADAGKFLRVTVTPVDMNGLAGTPSAPSTPVQIGNEIAYYVATPANGGDDNNSGNEQAPFATIEKARDRIRSDLNNQDTPAGTLKVYIKAGEYPVSKTISFGPSDSGTDKNPVVYQAYPGDEGQVRFVGGKALDASQAVKLERGDPIYERVIDEFAKTKLYKLDLKAQGITKIDKIEDFGFGNWTGSVSTYKPVEIYFNGKALYSARWPNDEPNAGYTQTGKLIEKPKEISKDPFTVEYLDSENHTELWTPAAADDLHISGFLGNDWAGVTHKVHKIDTAKKTITCNNGTAYEPSPNHRLYFFNLPEEIDMPGESYIDRENGILYFYPTDENVKDAKIEITTLKNYMFSFSGVKNLTLRGLNFEVSQDRLMDVSSAENFVIDECSFLHGSEIALALSGTNNVVKNSHIYDMGKGGITVGGGNRATLTGGGNLVENNRIHSVARVYRTYPPNVSASGVGHTIRNNAIYDGPHELVAFNQMNDLTIEYNEIYNGVRDAADMGAIYFGRIPDDLGTVIRHNFFHDIGNTYGGYGQQSIFWDDGQAGPYVFGNLFYRGTRTADMGGTTNNCFPIKSHGGQYGVVANNVIIDAPTATFFQPWSDDGAGNHQALKWWLWTMDKHDATFHRIWEQWMSDGKYKSDIWKEHYKSSEWDPAAWSQGKYNRDTMFGYLPSTFTDKDYNDVKNLDRINDKEALKSIAKDRAPSDTNIFDNNVVIGVEKTNPAFNGVAQEYRTYQAGLEESKSLFKDFNNRDFELTTAGLAKVREKATGFAALPSMDEMGLQRMENGTLPGGMEPSASNVAISGSNRTNGILTVDYTFSDPDGDEEGVTEITWYMSDKADGDYTLISGKQGKELKVLKNYEGMFVRCEVKPYDENGVYGEPVTSNVIQITMEGGADKEALYQAISEAQEMLKNANIGDELGQYPHEAADRLKGAIEKAETVANNTSATQRQVDAAAQEMLDAISDFKSSLKIDQLVLNSRLLDTANWQSGSGSANGTLSFENNGVHLKPNGNGYLSATYVAETFLNPIFTFKLKVEDLDNTWFGIFFRHANYNSLFSTSYGVVIKPEQFELQSFGPSGFLGPNKGLVPNEDENKKPIFEAGKEYVIEIGAYDVGDATRLVFKVDGREIFNYLQTQEDPVCKPQNGVEGYFTMLATKSMTGISILPAYADTTQLKKTLDEARQAADAAVIGEGYGEYDSDALDTFIEAIAKAQDVCDNIDSSQILVDKAEADLRKALADFKAKVNSTVTISESTTVDIIAELGGNISVTDPNADVTLNMDKSVPQAALNITAQRNIGNIVFAMPDGTTVTGNGTLKAPFVKSEASVKPSGATVNNAIGMTADAQYLTTDHAVRIVLPGFGSSKTVSYVKDGKAVKLKTLSADNQETADATVPAGEAMMIKSGNDVIVWTKILTEFIAHSSSGGTDNPYIPGPGGGGSTGTTGTGSGTSGMILGGDQTKRNFVDIVGHWAQADIEEMASKGIVYGVTDTTFEPDRSITRAEFAALIVRALNLTTVVPQEWKDVANEAWYSPAVNAAANVGLVVGYDGWFRPDDPISREEIAVIMAKAYVFAGGNLESGAIVKFADIDDISDWAYVYVDSVTTVGLFAGMTPNTFVPQENATRAECASVIRRLLDKIN